MSVKPTIRTELALAATNAPFNRSEAMSTQLVDPSADSWTLQVAEPPPRSPKEKATTALKNQ